MTKNPKTIIGLFEQKYCKEGINGCDDFEQIAKAYMVAELYKESCKKVHLTQDELVGKLNVKRSYISKIERSSRDVSISKLKKLLKPELVASCAFVWNCKSLVNVNRVFYCNTM